VPTLRNPVKSEEGHGDKSLGLEGSSKNKIHDHRATETWFEQMSGSDDNLVRYVREAKTRLVELQTASAVHVTWP